ncbi:pyrroline-5-carboxylate reductase [Varunaivibrio sulfuroxidans]|uniref:Pyrroline-5-carboxylate reductase n=1 Tax=Varunaivibrio sulfuroxidans TaxID=1773489 RepID=A0A4R3J6E3_9PROT|nr:pyrroline-5-carboxylate reductase [Varunaivibrio sulfuroxidans]TCS60894.1 pyrroline-5-carboxylate reductase [Varunaivibrio sulfuroxidans]WES31697.1 pyrroline-5-carboxylate reductase [Varunaivibrio sulfuroxidans]
MATRLVLAGGGKMGGAMLKGWLDRGVAPDDIYVIEPNEERAGEIVRRHRVHVLSTADNIPPALTPDAIVLAVKPQMMDDVARQYRRFVGPRTVFLSIAAGRTLDGFTALLGADAAVVRAMPNTPCAVRKGITVACAGANVGAPAQALCQSLLEAVGEALWIEDESLMDGVTALSGSGPAYVFLLVESLARAGVHAGLPEALAERLARATVIGAAELLDQSGEAPATLRQNVTSPGGTTAEALAVLMRGDGWQDAIDRAIAAAARRSRELAS